MVMSASEKERMKSCGQKKDGYGPVVLAVVQTHKHDNPLPQRVSCCSSLTDKI